MLSLQQIEECIDAYQDTLCKEVDVGGLFARNKIAHKWKVTYRVLLLRELVSWRFCDLMKQSVLLEKNNYFLGSRIIIRSGIETLTMLIYCTQKMENIVRVGSGFHEFSQKTTKLLLGSKDERTNFSSINIMDVLKTSAKKYPELLRAYDDLSEVTHPNWDGMSYIYSDVYEKGMVTRFTNDTGRKYKDSQLAILSLLCSIFEIEYNDSWIKAFDAFELWIIDNDTKLEKTKPLD